MDAGDETRPGNHGLAQLLREAVRARRGESGEWASAIALLVHSALIEHAAVDADAPGRVIVEVIDTTTGRCVEIGASRHSDDSQSSPRDSSKKRRHAARSHTDRALVDAFSTAGGLHLRAIARGFDSSPSPSASVATTTPLCLSPTADSELRLAMIVAVETLAEHIIGHDRRRVQILERLTDSQRRIIPYLIDDLSEREISERIGRSPHTVHDHVKGIYTTLAVSSRRELLALWYADQQPRSADVSG
ncbi:MAG: helix-turn-helix transcriptional regulator [Phycisphaeraceae bacterium]|nr:helix-turn-helix transcriptional regulator [Phycisphaeraceae bacterium]